MREIVWGPLPAVLLDRKALCIGDLHIGLERELWKKGVRLRDMTKEMLDDVLGLVKKTRAKEVIVLGDLKNSIGVASPREQRDVPLFLNGLAGQAEVRVVLGNHDGGLKPLLHGLDVHDARGFVWDGKYLVCHGNAIPAKKDAEQCREIIACHWHPVFEFKDRLGSRITEKIWVEARALGKPLLMMPAFNKLLGGVTIDRIGDKWVDLMGAKLWLTDGVFLGEFHGKRVDKPLKDVTAL
jgi:putative SbcD/Mre11-related phosphoesterase